MYPCRLPGHGVCRTIARMDRTTPVNRFLSGEALRLGLLAGARRVIAARDELNRINVFPVPDKDTGSNLAATMRGVVAKLNRPHTTIASVGASVAAAALSSAQGNSGVILAQFFQGLREGFSDAAELSVAHFVSALRRATTSARKALAEPQEGTILTVITDVAEHLSARLAHLPSFRELIDEGVQAARASLARTPEKLASLKRAGVVDAGALGFVRFLEGIRDYLVEGRMAAPATAQPPDKEAADAVRDVWPERADFRYCTEAVVSGSIDRPRVIEVLQGLGDSIVVAGSDEEVHAHVHTNVPAHVLEELAAFGPVNKTKVDDMFASLAGVPSPSANRAGIALVTDSVCNLPMPFFTEHRIHVVPMQIGFGQQTYLDRVDMTPSQFYKRWREDPVFPRTSQPSPASFLALYRHLSRHHEAILSVHISAEVSGTVQAATVAASQVSQETGVPIEVVDSRSASSAEGLVMWAAARAVAEDRPLDVCARVARQAADDASVIVFIPSIEGFVRGGRLSPLRGKISNILRLRPVLTVVNGSLTVAAKVFGVAASRRRAVKTAMKRARGMTAPVFCLSHSAAPQLAADVEKTLRAAIPQADVMITEAAPALGSHAGPGGIAIAVLDGQRTCDMIHPSSGAGR